MFGPTLTPWGEVTVRIVHPRREPAVVLDAKWRSGVPKIDITIPGFAKIIDADLSQPLLLERDLHALSRLIPVPESKAVPSHIMSDPTTEEGLPS
jgi:hypothetical protein